MKRDVTSPRAYVADVVGAQRELLEAIRKLVRKAAPGIREQLEYGMLSYPGLCSLAAQKHYVSLYVLPSALAEHASAFTGVGRGKSCLRFRKLSQVDESSVSLLLADVLEARSKGGA